MTELIGDDELELRAIESRVFALHESWTRANLDGQGYINSLHDCGMLSAIQAILDTFLGGDTERDAWIAKRDDERTNSRMLFALRRFAAAPSPAQGDK